MKSAIRRIAAMMLCGALVGSTLAGCGKSDKPAANNSSTPSAQATADANKATTYPIKTDVTLTYWIPSTYLPPNITGQQDVPYLTELEKRTGVKVKYTIASGTNMQDVFNLMIASGDLPDIIDGPKFAGGPESGLKNGYILKLTDTLAKNAPNLKKYLISRPEIDKMVKTDSGDYYGFPLIRGEDPLTTFGGLFLRKDWLDELGLQVPTTMDEWYTVLKAFKEKQGATGPLLINPMDDNYWTSLTSAFGIRKDFYMDNGKVKFGAAEPAYKEFLTTMRKWYSEGLIDKNFSTSDSKSRDADITTGKAGAMFGMVGGGIGKYNLAVQPTNPKYNLVAAPYPTLKKGDKPKIGFKSNYYNIGEYAAISAKSKNAEIAAKFLDYGYSKEGHMLFNFGTEGVSYKMENGSPVYTDLIMNNPEKKTPAQMIPFYLGASSRGSGFVQDLKYFQQYLALPQQKEAINIWANTDAIKYNLPPITQTEANANEYAKLVTDLNTYVNEMTAKFILGAAPIEDFDKYIENIKKLNINRIIEINQTALDRFNKR